MHIPKFRYIRDDVSIYLYYAGRGREFIEVSRDKGRIFLDLPGLILNENALNDESGIVQALHRADATRRYVKNPTSFPRPRAVSDYSRDFPLIDGRVDRSFVADFSNIEIMFRKADIGDVIVMTPSSHYGTLLIGEIISNFDDDHTMTLIDESPFTTPYREVRWIPHDLTRRDFTVDVARRLQNRRTITRIDSDFYPAIFRYVYKAYIWGNTSKFDIYGPEYNSSDPTSNSEASFLIKYAVAFYAAYVEERTDEFYRLSPEDAADAFFSEEIALQISQAFGSPGGYVAKLIGTSAGPAIALLLAILLSPESQSIDTAVASVTSHAQTYHSSAHSGLDLNDYASKLRVGSAAEVRATYGRRARTKTGLTLEGNEPPELAVQRRRQNHQ